MNQTQESSNVDALQKELKEAQAALGQLLGLPGAETGPLAPSVQVMRQKVAALEESIATQQEHAAQADPMVRAEKDLASSEEPLRQ